MAAMRGAWAAVTAQEAEALKSLLASGRRYTLIEKVGDVESRSRAFSNLPGMPCALLCVTREHLIPGKDMTDRFEGIVGRLDRLESIDAIRQLAAKYSLALDMRDSDAWVSLFPDDVAVGGGRSGRKALRDWFDETHSRQFDGTSHHIGGHIIEFDDPDHAQGIVYSKNEHESGADWVIMQMMYFDRYERVDGCWYFRRRLPLYWYATDLNKPPIGGRKMRWPGVPPYEGSFHDLFPSWKTFWERGGGPSDLPVADPAPLEKFIDTMRKGHPLPKPRVRS